jgi:hypothetical protein
MAELSNCRSPRAPGHEVATVSRQGDDPFPFAQPPINWRWTPHCNTLPPSIEGGVLEQPKERNSFIRHFPLSGCLPRVSHHRPHTKSRQHRVAWTGGPQTVMSRHQSDDKSSIHPPVFSARKCLRPCVRWDFVRDTGRILLCHLAQSAARLRIDPYNHRLDPSRHGSADPCLLPPGITNSSWYAQLRWS